MSTPLIQQIAERLGIDVYEVERSLDDLVSKIRQDAEKTGSSEIKGLGVFKADAGSLAFVPDETLELLVNQRFAGLDVLGVESDAVKDQSGDHPPMPDTNVEEEAIASPETFADQSGDLPADIAAVDEAPEQLPDNESDTASLAEAPAEEVVPMESTPENDDVSEPLTEAGPEAFADDDLDESEEVIWNIPPESPGDHPLGTLSESTIEDAEFEVEAQAELSEAGSSADTDESVAPSASTSGDSGASDELSDEDKELFELLRFGIPQPESSEADSDSEEPGPEEEAEADDDSLAAIINSPSTTLTEDTDVLDNPDERPAPESNSKTPASKRGAHSRYGQDRSSNRGIMIIGVIALLVGAVLAYYFLKPKTATVPDKEETAETTIQPSDTTIASGMAQDTVAVETASEEPVPAKPAGIDRSAGGWTIIVGSEITEESANITASQFRDLGYPVDILAGSSGGQPRFRVALGQFATEEEVLSTLRSLSKELPAGSWRLRIRPNM